MSQLYWQCMAQLYWPYITHTPVYGPATLAIHHWLQKGDQKVVSSLTTCPYQLKGLHTYASWWAYIFDTLCEHFTGIWSGLELPQENLTKHTHCVHLNSDLMELDGDDF